MPHIQEPTGERRQVKPVLDALLQPGLDPDQLWQQFLQLACEILGSEAGVLWVIPPDADSLVPKGLSGNVDFRQPVMQRDSSQVSHVLQAAATDEVTQLHPELREDEPLSGRTILAVPVHSDGHLYGVLELFQPVEQEAEELQERQRELESAIEQVSAGLSEPRQPEADEDNQFWQEFENFNYNLHQSLVLRTVADVAANDGRQLLRCDRLSIAVHRGRKTTILAVSDQDQVNRRSEEVRSLQRLAAESASVGEIIEYRSDQADIAPHLRDALSRHIELAAVKFIRVIPLFAAARRKPGTEDDPRSEPDRPVVGCMLIEQFRQLELEPSRTARIPAMADTMGSAVANALLEQQTLLVPTRRLLGKGLDYFRGRTLAKTLAVIALLLTITLTLIFVPWTYRVEAEGRLMPEVQRRVFAPWEGVVSELHVDNGQRVSEGDPLLTIYNDELHAEVIAAQNELSENRQELLSLQAEINEMRNHPTERRTEAQSMGRMAETHVAIRGLEKQLKILTRREDSLKLTAPIDGVVATFQLVEKLRNRPVAQGEHLLEVMDDSAEWILEVELPEHRMGHLLRSAQKSGETQLDVEYVLATDATGTYTGQLNLTDVGTRSEVSRESEVVVAMQVRTDKAQLPFLRIGGEATAKIDCGEMSLGYVLLGDVWEFVMRYVWI